MKKLVTAIFIAVTLLQPLRAMAAFQTPDIRLDTGDAPGASGVRWPLTCNTSDGHVYAAWIDYRNSTYGNIFFNRSADFGHTWQATPIQISVDLARWNGGLNMACVDDGRIEITYADSDWTYFSLFSYQSSDYGATWILNYLNSLAMEYSSETNPTPRLCMTNAGETYRAIEDNSYWPFQPDKTDIVFGAVGGDPQYISHGFGQSKNPIISCTENGHVYVAWEDYRNDFMGYGVRDIFFNYSTDYGQTWQPADIQLNTETWDSDNAFWPYISSTENGHVYVAWTDTRNGNEDVYFNQSSNSGGSWQALETRIDTGDTAGASKSWAYGIAKTENGAVYVIYYDLRNSSISDVFINRSTDYGLTWRTPDIRIDPGDNPGEHNSIGKIRADDNGGVYAVIRDDRFGGWDLLFTKSSDYGATWSSAVEKINTGTPEGSGSVCENDFNIDSLGHVYVAWRDDRAAAGMGDVYFNYWTSSQSGIPTLSDYMMLILALALFCMLLIIARGRSSRVSSRVP